MAQIFRSHVHPMNRLLTLAATVALAASPIALAAQQHGVNTAAMDRSVKPGDDFYSYAGGTYIRNAQIPADRISISVFSIIADRTLQQTTSIVTDSALASASAGSDARKIHDLYASYMDEAAIEAHGRAAVDEALKPIAAVHDRTQLAAALGHSLRNDVDALNNTNFHTANLFGMWVAPGFNDPDHYAPYILQGGLGMPTRDYYLSDSPRMQSIRDAYRKHVANNFHLLGLDNPDQRAAAVLALETAIARVQVSLADSEEIGHANNPWTLADFQSKAPGLDWKTYFAAASLGDYAAAGKPFIVWQPAAFTAESALVASQPVDTWKDFLIAHLVDAYTGGISKAFADERFEYTRVLTGAQAQRPRQQRAVFLTSDVLGDAVGKIYADKFFTAAEKTKVQVLVANLIAAFHQRLETLTWMAPATRKEAIVKLEALKVGIGFPDTFRTYTALEIKPDDYFGNLWRDSLFEYHYSLSRIGQPTDRSEWTMSPQTVNAVNLPLHNGLNFPAAILQAPFYDPLASDAFNYGSIGSVIGHEVSHTFDSEGAAFDDKGRVRNWWTPDDLAHFNASTAALAAQYDAYAPFPDLHVNGKQTLGENIADVAGLQAAYDAYRASLHGKEAPSMDGFTGDQQFFLGFAQGWTGKERENALRQQVLSDSHSPAMYRAATVRNIDAWYSAFHVQPGDKLYLPPDQRVHIW